MLNKNIKKEENMNIAIIYYSRGGKTEGIAKKIQAKTNGDLYKIEPNKDYGTYLSFCYFCS